MKLYRNLMVLIFVVVCSNLLKAEINSTIVYQGTLSDAGQLANGLYDMTFTVHDDPNEGNQIGNKVSLGDIVVINGSFNVMLDFGPDVFNGENRWLSTEVKGENDPRITRLSPRQKIMATPYSVYAKRSGAPWVVDANGVHYIEGKVGIGLDADTNAKLAIAGSVKIQDGSEGEGKVLTSNQTGLASWKNPVPGIPTGGIIMWSGPVDNIPTGWALCDGTNSTPDLRDRFIVGIGITYNIGNTGGSKVHTHGAGSYLASEHTHTYSGETANNSAIKCQDEGGSCSHQSPETYHTHFYEGTTDSGGSGTISGTSAEGSSLPPYFALAFIMKL